MFAFSVLKPWFRHRMGLVVLSLRTRRAHTVTLGLTLASVGAFALTPSVHLDAPRQTVSTVIDPATEIEFPTTLHIPSRFPLPPYTLLGVGVRKVSFLGIKVYSVGFYADLTSVPPSALFFTISWPSWLIKLVRRLVVQPALKIKYDMSLIRRHVSCGSVALVPTRSTSYSHLRDGFMRAIQGRMILQKNKGLLSADAEAGAASPLLKFKSMFPNTPLTKHTPLDVILTAPPAATGKDTDGRERQLIVRDLGSISNDWISKEFMLAYFEDQGISPPLKQAVEERLRDFGN